MITSSITPRVIQTMIKSSFIEITALIVNHFGGDAFLGKLIFPCSHAMCMTMSFEVSTACSNAWPFECM
ncbi:hypothetical protein VNO77_27562 [Canavalia gladiata]|uniref:Uncharacterized protein n=1 Tax=Canavalia gladiata TaxID=3824 RepID=A0AAN9QAL9_CANGL